MTAGSVGEDGEWTIPKLGFSHLTKLSADISTLKDDVSGLKQEVSALKDDVSGLRSKLDLVYDHVAKITENQTENSKRIANV